MPFTLDPKLAMRKTRHLILVLQTCLACLSGLLVAASFPPLGWWPCIVVAWLPLLAAVRDGSASKAFRLGLLQGLVAYGFSLYWFGLIFGLTCVSFFTLLALFVALFCALFNFACRHVKPPLFMALLASLLWISIEYFRSELFFLRFSWITPGMAVGPVWLTPILGVYGVSFIVFSGSSFLLWKRTRVVGLLLVALVLALGLFRPPPVEPSGNAIRAAAIQNETSFFEIYYYMTQGLTNAKPQLIVWPEFSVLYDIRQDKGDQLEALKQLAAKMNAVIVLGTKTILPDSDGEWYNTALVIDGSGVLGEYYKHQPVHFFDDGKAGESLAPIATPIAKLATPICFDFDFSGIMRLMTLEGAELFAVPSYDATHWSETQHRQHSAILGIRAAENGRWVVCAASSGLSQIIDPNGHIHEVLGPMEEGVIVGDVDVCKGMTFFVRAGWLFPWLCIAASTIWLAGIGLRALQDHRPRRL